MSADNPDLATGEVNIFTADFAACPQPTYRSLVGRCPVARAVYTGGPVISRYEDVVWALRHPEIFSSAMSKELALGTDRPMIPQQIDPPLQTKFRKILDPLFSRRRMLAIEPDLRLHANEIIDKFIDAGECDFNLDFAIPLPCSAFLSLMSLPQGELELFLELKNSIIRPQTTSDDPEEPARIRAEAGRRIYAYFEGMIDERATKPLDDDVVSYLMNAEIDGEKLTRNDILDICFLLLLGGLDTVTATLGCNIAFLAANPEHRRRIALDPASIPNAVEELLRWETPVMGVPRKAVRDVTLHDFEIKEGEIVMLMLGAADIDASAFPHADDVDFDRERNRHLAFGGGPHRCLGSHLARLELTTAMEEWHRRIPDYSIKPGETPRYSPGIREVLYLPIVWSRR